MINLRKEEDFDFFKNMVIFEHLDNPNAEEFLNEENLPVGTAMVLGIHCYGIVGDKWSVTADRVCGLNNSKNANDVFVSGGFNDFQEFDDFINVLIQISMIIKGYPLEYILDDLEELSLKSVDAINLIERKGLQKFIR